MNLQESWHPDYAPHADTGSGFILDETYLRGKYGENITEHLQFPADCLAPYAELLEVGKERKWSEKEFRMVNLSVMVMMESLESKIQDGRPLRDDGHSWAWHAHTVALECAKLGVSPETVAEAYDHDVIEDTVEYPDGPQITQGDLRTIFTSYDQEGVLAASVSLFTKLKTTNLKRNEPHETHRRLYGLIRHKAESVTVKLVDRKNYLETCDPIQQKLKREAKARETMDYYVPLAVGLGLHKLAQELAELSVQYLASRNVDGKVELPFATAAYENVLSDIQEAVKFYKTEADLSGIVDVNGRVPDAGDAYKLTHGRVDNLTEAWIPAYLTIVLKQEHAKSAISTDLSFVRSATPIMLFLKENSIISDHEYRQYFNLLGAGVQRTIHIDIVSHGIPIRLRFVREDQEIIWQSSVLDLVDGSEVSELQYEAAKQKIAQLKDVYEYYIEEEMRTKQLFGNINECLMKGTTEVFIHSDRINRRMVLPANATALDMAYLLDRKGGYIPIIERKVGDSWQSVSVNSEIRSAGVYRVRVGDAARLSPAMLDAVHTRYGKDRVQALLKARLKKGNYDAILAQGLIDRGERVVDSLYQRYARDQGDENIDLATDVVVARNAINRVLMKEYLAPPNDTDRVLNFLLRVGLGDLPVDTGRTSIVWWVVEELYDHQSTRENVVLKLPNTPGQLNRVTRALRNLDINIANIGSSSDYRLRTRKKIAKRTSSVVVTLDKDNYDKFIAAGGMSLFDGD